MNGFRPFDRSSSAIAPKSKKSFRVLERLFGPESVRIDEVCDECSDCDELTFDALDSADFGFFLGDLIAVCRRALAGELAVLALAVVGARDGKPDAAGDAVGVADEDSFFDALPLLLPPASPPADDCPSPNSLRSIVCKPPPLDDVSVSLPPPPAVACSWMCCR